MLAVEVRLWVKNYIVFVFVLTRRTWACWNAEKPVKEGREEGGSLRGRKMERQEWEEMTAEREGLVARSLFLNILLGGSIRPRGYNPS